MARDLESAWADAEALPASRTTRGRSTARPRGPGKAPVRSDVYTGLLGLALLAQLAGAVFLYLDYNEYPAGKAPPEVSASAGSAKRPTPGGGGDTVPPDKGGPEKDKEKEKDNKQP